MLGLRCWVGFSLVVVSRGYSLVAVCGLLIAVASLAGLKLNIQKTKIMVSGPITSWQIDGKTMETDRLSFLRLQNHCRW